MRTATAALFCLVAIQAFLGVWGKVKKGNPDVSQWISTIKVDAKKHGRPVPNISQTILGGGATGSMTPYFVGLGTQVKLCGGALISDWFVVSAASCTETVDQMGIAYVGVYGSEQESYFEQHRIYPESIYNHPYYDCANGYNDISIYVLEFPATFTEEIQPIALPFNDSPETSYEGFRVFYSGYGSVDANDYTIPSDLQTKEQEVTSFGACASYAEFSDLDSNMHFCTARTGEQKGACFGDEGGPVVLWDETGKWLIGIVGFQPYLCPPAVEFPSRHTKVAYYLGWFAELFGGGEGGDWSDNCTLKRKIRLMKIKRNRRNSKKHKKAKKSKTTEKPKSA